MAKKKKNKGDPEFDSREGLRRAAKRDMLNAERRTSLLPDSWLEAATNRNEDWWIGHMQGLVSKHSQKTGNPDHDCTDVRLVMADLCKTIVESAPPNSVYDGNMRTAAIMGMVLALWYARLQFAKASDPARPAYFRQLGYKRHVEYVTCMMAGLVDGRRDSMRFPGQKWDNPYAADAKNGDYI